MFTHKRREKYKDIWPQRKRERRGYSPTKIERTRRIVTMQKEQEKKIFTRKNKRERRQYLPTIGDRENKGFSPTK